MSTLAEIVKPLLDAGAGPLREPTEDYQTDPGWQSRGEQAGWVFCEDARLMWIGWLAEQWDSFYVFRNRKTGMWSASAEPSSRDGAFGIGPCRLSAAVALWEKQREAEAQ